MPVMKGADATRALRAGGCTALIIGMTGDPVGSPERSEFEASGLNACVDKDRKGIEYLIGLLQDMALDPDLTRSFSGSRRSTEREVNDEAEEQARRPPRRGGGPRARPVGGSTATMF